MVGVEMIVDEKKSDNVAKGRLIDGRIPTASEYLAECISAREVLFRIVWRDLSIRFRQAYAGLGWMLAKPIMMAMILTFVFGKVSGFEKSTQWPYALLVLLGWVPWQYFSLAAGESVSAFLNNRSLVTHTYFPRALIPSATALGLLTDFAIPMGLVVALMAWHQILPGWSLLWFPVWFCFYLAFVLAFALVTSSLNARLRDVQHALPFVLQLGMFATPVAYVLHSVPEPWRMVLAINPMVGMIESFRWMFLPGYPLDVLAVGWSAAFTLCFVAFSVHAFLRLDKHLAEVL